VGGTIQTEKSSMELMLCLRKNRIKNRCLILFLEIAMSLLLYIGLALAFPPAGPDTTLYCPEIRNELSRNGHTFAFGVASGDPTPNSLWIWTLLNPYARQPIAIESDVHWEVATDNDFKQIVRAGVMRTTAEQAYSCKLRLDSLPSGTRLNYRFRVGGDTSAVGLTRTLPDKPERLRLAVASCSNWEWGYFNAYRSIAQLNDLDLVLHLGDYIYEYEPGRYGSRKMPRKHLPAHEIVSLSDYRSRYAQYHLDPDLQELRRRVPLVSVWDDHEIANDAWRDGAQNHQESIEGPYNERQLRARRTYFEWLPVDANEGMGVRRSLSLGQMADLFLLDGRLEGRSQQVKSADDPERFDSSRSMLGEAQRDWLIEQVGASNARWKLIGNQVIFSAYDYPVKLTRYSKNMDMWEGYPIERDSLLRSWWRSGSRNLIMLTGDVHASFAMDLRVNYRDPSTSMGVEWVAPSISSGSLDEYQPRWKVRLVERWFRAGKMNPHLNYLNFRDHGFILVELNAEQASATWMYERNILKPKAHVKKRVKRHTSRT
jgi:alkaline phosphatase D